MNRWRQLIIVTLLLFVLIAAGCGRQNGANKAQKKVSAEKKIAGFKIKLTTPKKVVSRGDNVTLALEIQNVTKHEIKIIYPTAQGYDFEIKDRSGKTVWTWSRGRLFAQVISERTLTPGEKIDFSAVWPQLNNAGRSVKSGKYVIFGRWLAKGLEDNIQAEITVGD